MRKISDLLLSPKKAERHPFEIFLIAFFYASISLFLASWIFPGQASIVSIFLTVIACLYLAEGCLIVEEKSEKNTSSEKSLLKKHSKVLILFLSLFLGFLAASALWTIVLPESLVRESFSLQSSTLEEVAAITGKAISPQDSLSIILSNNFRVLLLSLLFALFYGAGAIFILAWNASLMGFVIGNLAKNSLGLSYLPLITMKYFLHGIPEMISYFLAAMAGGILFIALIKGDLRKGRLKRTFSDFSILLVSSVIILILAALIEVYISPSL